MILAALALATAVVELAKTLIDKLVSQRHTPTIHRKLKRGTEFAGKTIEGIRQVGIRKGWIREDWNHGN